MAAVMRRALILTDGKAGHENQSKAFARALGCEFELCPVKFKSRIHKSLSYVLDRLGVRTTRLFEAGGVAAAERSAAKEGVAVVIGTGSGTFYAAKSLAKRLGVPCGVVLYPRGYDIPTFDCVLAPSFDRPEQLPNVIAIPANLVANDAAFYEAGVEEYRKRCSPVAAMPDVAVIVGGPNARSTMTAEWMKRRLDAIFTQPGVKAVTTSRRTPPDVETVVASYPWDYALLYSKDHFNPIPAFVKLAKRLYVTAESTGMLSEACTFGSAEVVAMDNLQPGSHKFRRFVDGLVSGGYATWNDPATVPAARKIDLSPQFAAARRLLFGEST